MGSWAPAHDGSRPATGAPDEDAQSERGPAVSDQTASGGSPGEDAGAVEGSVAIPRGSPQQSAGDPAGHAHETGSDADRSAEAAVRSTADEDAGTPAATDGRPEPGAHRSTAA